MVNLWYALINGILIILRFIGDNWYWLLAIPFVVWLIIMDTREKASNYMDDEREIF